jgi:hypothetical protein
MGMATLFGFYPTIAAVALQTFRCTGDAIAGTSYLIGDLAVPCSGPAHATAMFVAGGIALPLITLLPVVWLCSALAEFEASAVVGAMGRACASMVLRMDPVGFCIAGLTAQGGAPHLRVGALWLRRLSLALAVALPSTRQLQLCWCLLVLAGCCCLHMATPAFVESRHNTQELLSLGTALIFCISLLLAAELPTSALAAGAALSAVNLVGTLAILFCMMKRIPPGMQNGAAASTTGCWSAFRSFCRLPRGIRVS